jgi:hypothetical protein
MLTDITLDQRAYTYIRDQLTDGDVLARHLVGIVNDGGTVYALLPEGVSLESASSFVQGGKLPTPPSSEWRHGKNSIVVPVPNTNEALAGKIESFLTGGEQRICVFENAVARTRFPYVAHFTDILICADRVYHVIRGPSPTRSDVLSTIREAASLQGCLGAMTSLPDRLNWPKGSQQMVSEADLAELAQRSEKVIVGAYDGESYVIWER